MATNWSQRSSDYPSREDVARMEADDRRRDTDYSASERRIQSYLRNHPSASWAEANYKTTTGRRQP